MRLRSRLALLALGCAACTQEAAPTSPGQVLFIIDPGGGNRGFAVVEISAANAQHEINSCLEAPYQIYMQNSLPPAQGVFLADTPTALADVSLLTGGDVVPRVVTEPSQNSVGCPSLTEVSACGSGLPQRALCVNSCVGAKPGQECVIPVLPASDEVRFDVVSVPQALFNASVGGINENYLISNALAPATIYTEGVTELAQGVFNKTNPNSTLSVTLLVNGVAEAFDSSPSGSTDSAVVEFQLSR